MFQFLLQKENEKILMIEKFATNLFQRLVNTSDLQYDRIKYLKCKYAMEFLVLNISKLFIVYIFAYTLGIMLEVVVFHISFMSIRIYAFGAHANNNLYCTIITVSLFIGAPLLINQILIISKLSLALLFLLNFVIIFKYAPACTGYQMYDDDERILLRNRAIRINFCLAMVSLLLPSLYFGNLIGVGAFLGAAMLLPLTSHVLNGKKRGVA